MTGTLFKQVNYDLDSLTKLIELGHSRGSTLLVGVSDDGQTLGLEVDEFENEDKMHRPEPRRPSLTP